MKVKFKDFEHRDFYLSMKEKCTVWDNYHKAFFYTIGLSDDTRKHVKQIFDFEDPGILPECLAEPWQTSGSDAICRMAFNLWNGYVDDEDPYKYTPDNLFSCNYAMWFWQAIQLRYPEYMLKESNDITED